MDAISTTDARPVSKEELAAALRDKDIVLIDVLSPESYATAHIDGAINLPVSELQRQAPEVLPDRRSSLVVYCGGPT